MGHLNSIALLLYNTKLTKVSIFAQVLRKQQRYFAVLICRLESCYQLCITVETRSDFTSAVTYSFLTVFKVTTLVVVTLFVPYYRWPTGKWPLFRNEMKVVVLRPIPFGLLNDCVVSL